MPLTEQQIRDLYAERRAAIERARAALDAAEAEGRDLTPAEIDTYERAMRDADRLGEQITRELDRLEATTRDAELNDRIARAISGQPAPTRTWLPSRHEYRDLEARAVTGSANPFVPVEQANVFFDRLRAASVVLAAGPTVLTTDSIELNVPKISASVTVGTYAENAQITATDPTFDAVTLHPRKVAALCLASNESLSDSTPGLRDVIAGDLVRSTAGELDRQMLAGNGTPPNMTGLRNTAGATVQWLGANGAVPTLDDFAAAVEALEGADAAMSTAAWFASPRTWATIREAKDGQSRYQMSPDPSRDGPRRLFGAPVYLSNHIPNDETRGTSNDCSTVLLADMTQVVVARRQDVELAYSNEYRFDYDQTAIRVVARYDIAAVNPEAVVIIGGVRA